MRNLKLFRVAVLLILAAGSAIAGPTITYDSKLVEMYTVLDNLWWDGKAPISTQWQHLPADNPYPGGHTAYNQAVADGLITEATLTVVVDDLDLSNSAHVWVRDKDGMWHYQDRYGNTMWLRTMDFADRFGLQEGSGNGADVVNEKGSHLTSTTFDLDPHWLDGVAVGVKLNWIVNGGLNMMEVETATLSVIALSPTVPAPGAILLSSIGVGIVGWLRRRRTL